MAKIGLVIGTGREKRFSENVALYLKAEAEKVGFEIDIIDVRDYPLTATVNDVQDEMKKAYQARVDELEGFIWVVPEYNHSYPGEFKQMVDLAYFEYFNKPVALVGTSMGPWGGTRVIEVLRLLAVTFHMVPTGEPMMFTFVQDAFNGNGSMKEPKKAEALQKFFGALHWYTDVLTPARAKRK